MDIFCAVKVSQMWAANMEIICTCVCVYACWVEERQLVKMDQESTL